ncbi:hypothetical protein B0A52_02118 [Exophiala mesophila]|uniref:Dicer-like protein 1 n=1 Tax=Exophiala mesophila TaxID=212818 RepID=A0A438NEW9_EXOME|nr:hypothetical protein B0A52_02118 [Exophiala mesophila]
MGLETSTSILSPYPSDDESGSGSEVSITRPSSGIASPIHSNTAAFAEFISSNSQELRLAESQGPSAPRGEIVGSVIDKARDYQEELFERAKDENVIAVLDTGSGKTLIAALLIRHYLQQELLDRAQGRPRKIIFFLVNSVHLARQQARFLNLNLPQPVIPLFGDSHDDLWRRASWEKIFAERTVVVCTAAVLDQCLMHSFLTIDQISLLVFDEAHHCKKNHPYARIIRDYYLKCSNPRPRIFGMTASPVDSKRDVAKVANDLEDMLQSKIVTTNDLSIFDFAPRARGAYWLYPRLGPELDTELTSNLRSSVGFVVDLQKYFDYSRQAARELGSWAADKIWHYVLARGHQSAEVMKKVEVQLRDESSDLDYQQTRQNLVAAAISLVENHQLGPVNPDDIHNLSPKVQCLYQKLKDQYSAFPDTRAIILTDRRLAAYLLCDIFQSIGLPNIRLGVLVGVSRSSSETASFRNQEAVMEKFRDGRINLIFATSVAEEGIDIPQCNLVARFDLYKTPIQYMQSRGRARVKDSIFAHMMEVGDAKQLAHVNYAIEMDEYIRLFCQRLPPDRKLGRGTKLKQLMTRDASCGSFVTKENVIANFNNSLILLNRYSESLRVIGAEGSEVYVEMIDAEHDMFKYKVVLPPVNEESQVKVRGATGEARTNKILAKRAAAFKCCQELYAAGLLDENLDSIFRKVKPENLNRRTAVPAKLDQYEKNLKPNFWLDGGVGSLDLPTHLFVTRVTFLSSTGANNKRSILLFTRRPLPPIPKFPVFLDENVEHEVLFSSLPSSVSVTTEQIDHLTCYTLNAVFADIFNKVYEAESHNMSYWLAPPSNHTDDDSFDALVDFKELTTAASPERLQWKTINPLSESHCPSVDAGKWQNAFLVDPGSGKFHYLTNNTVAGVTIWDKPPANAFRGDKKYDDTIVEFTDSTWRRKGKDLKTFADKYDARQPVINATLIISGRNFLESCPEDQQRSGSCYIAPQPLEVARVSKSMAEVLLVWPAVMHKLESYLIVGEAFSKLDLQEVPLGLALEAYTQDNNGVADLDMEEGDQLPDPKECSKTDNVKQGTRLNYERLEFIGDSLLKMMTTITVFNRTNADEEGMHCKRMALLSNSRLFSVASKPEYALYRYIRAGTGEKWRDTWYPEFLTQKKGRKIKLSEKQRSHALGQKTIADVCEATIGACIMTSQHLPTTEKFDLGIKAITKLVEDPDHDIVSWAQVAPMYKPPRWSLDTQDLVAINLADTIFKITGYRFKRPRLLRSAFTHSSDQNSPVQDLQRLEFLGDACLDWVCIWWLFSSNPHRGPQWLTEHKMAMVSNKFLAALAVDLQFHKHLIASHASLSSDIARYVGEIDDVRHGQDDVKADFWTRLTTPPPKALADLVESYLGAMLVDSNFDFVEIEKFFEKHVKPFFEDIEAYDTFANRHPTTHLSRLLHEYFHCQGTTPVTLPQVETSVHTSDVSRDDEAVAGVTVHVGWVIHGKVICSSRGTSKGYAKTSASKMALSKLENLSVEEFRATYGCDCTTKKSKREEAKRAVGQTS